MSKILVVYATSEGRTEEIVETIAERMSKAGHAVETTPVESVFDGQIAEADGVLLAASVHFGRHAQAARDFVQSHQTELISCPSGFLSVSLHAAKEETLSIAQGYLDAFLAESGWDPDLSGTAAGALRYSRYGFFKRLMMRQIARRKGLPTDASRDHDFTDEEKLADFTDRFLHLVNTSGERPETAGAG